jgi:hypothetical protein
VRVSFRKQVFDELDLIGAEHDVKGWPDGKQKRACDTFKQTGGPVEEISRSCCFVQEATRKNVEAVGRKNYTSSQAIKKKGGPPAGPPEAFEKRVPFRISPSLARDAERHLVTVKFGMGRPFLKEPELRTCGPRWPAEYSG